MRKLYGLSLGLLMLCFQTALAQTKEVTGKVTDSNDGSPLSGVTVKVKGSTTSTVTLSDGTFKFSVPENATTLVFTYVGYGQQELSISSLMNVSMTAGGSLAEVVVVGYGQTTKRDVTGSIAKVAAKEIENMPVQSFESAIQGKAPGVVIESGSGKVGQAIKVRIRGTSSISASSQPLYVVDGLPVISGSLSDGANEQTNPLADINPNDIESIEVLKDASAAAIYGARAANGVVLITTKKGKLGKKTVIELNLNNSFSNPTRKRKFLNAKQYVEIVREAASNDGKYDFANGISGYPSEQAAIDDFTAFYESAILDYFSLGTDWENAEVNTNWVDQLYRKNAQSKQADISLSGGSDKTRFFVSGFYNTQDAIVINNKFYRYGGRMNIEHNATSRLAIGLNLAVNRSQLDRVSNDNAFSTPGQLVAQLPISPLLDPNTGEINSTTLYANGLLDAKYNFDKQVTFRTIGNAYANYTILPSLSFRSEFGADVFNLNQESYQGQQTIDGAGIGKASFLLSQSVSFNTNNYFTYTPIINDDNKISAVAGMSYLQNDTRQAVANGENFPSDAVKNLTGAADITSASSAGSRYTFLSYFLRANYTLLDRYLLSVSVRADGSSRFGENNRYGVFPAASVGWVMSDENFLKNAGFLSFLKLRASYGLTGNAEIGESGYFALYGISNYPSLPGFVPSQLGNPDLKWEKTTQADIGLDFGFLDNRITGTVDYYSKHTTDLLLGVNIPATTGYSTILQNLGTMDNKGIEVLLNSRNIDGPNFKWSTSFNLGYNKNKVVDIKGQIITASTVQRAVEGEPIGSFFMQEFAGVDPATGEALYYDADGKTTNDYSLAERRIVGKAAPDFTGGFSNSFSYKGFDLNVLFTFVQGNDVYNGGGIYQEAGLGGGFDNQTIEILNRWQKPGDITNVPKVGYYYPTGERTSSRWLYDGSYIRLRTAQLGYTLPASVVNALRISSARFYVSGLNLWTSTKYPGDPEVNTATLGNISGGQDFYSIPQPRSITVGVNVKF